MYLEYYTRIIATQLLQNATQFVIWIAIFMQKLLLNCRKLFWTPLYVFLCMYVRVCICMFVCMYVCTYVCMKSYTCQYDCMRVCMYEYKYVRMYVSMYVGVYFAGAYAKFVYIMNFWCATLWRS